MPDLIQQRTPRHVWYRPDPHHAICDLCGAERVAIEQTNGLSAHMYRVGGRIQFRRPDCVPVEPREVHVNTPPKIDTAEMPILNGGLAQGVLF